MEYCLWASEQGINETNSNVKACIREIHSIAVERGKKWQKINSVARSATAKFMRVFCKRHPQLSKRAAGRVDRGRIMANQQTIDQ